MLTLMKDSGRMPCVERPHMIYSEQTPVLTEVTVGTLSTEVHGVTSQETVTIIPHREL
jgi:hypothetical protein